MLTFNRPSIAGAVQQTPLSFIDSLTDLVSSKSLKYIHSQTVTTEKLKFSEKVDFPPHVMWNVLPVTCYVSHVMCDLVYVNICFLFFG